MYGVYGMYDIYDMCENLTRVREADAVIATFIDQFSLQGMRLAFKSQRGEGDIRARSVGP